MRKRAFVIIFVVVALVFAAPAYAQIIGSERPDSPVDLNRPPVGDLDPVAPLPPPSEPATPFTSDETQLVGFTSQLFNGNTGVLNMSIGCQQQFPGARMCTMEEINMSVLIPKDLGSGYAWVKNLSDPAERFDLNCNGWMSDSAIKLGTSIDLGVCYGGVQMTTCNTQLAVACCSKVGFTILR